MSTPPKPNTTITDPNHPGNQLMRQLAQAITASGCAHATVLDVLSSLWGLVLQNYPCCYESGEACLQIHQARVRELITARMQATEAQALAAIAAARKAH